MNKIFPISYSKWISFCILRKKSRPSGISSAWNSKTKFKAHNFRRINANLSALPSPPAPPRFSTLTTTCASFSTSSFCHHVYSSMIQEENNGHTAAGHTPVMVEEVLSILDPKENQVIIDMTFGSGGHTKEILKKCPSLQQIITLDRDPVAYHLALDLAKRYRPRQILPLLGTFEDLPLLLAQEEIAINSIDGILIDSGVSSMQLDTPERGFSLSTDGLLDMRMDGLRRKECPSAANVVNSLDEKALSEIIKKYGEEKNAFKIAQAIVEARAAFGRIETTKQLAAIVASVFESPHKMDKLQRPAHVATKTFQALRIFVNNELNQLSNGLHVANSYLRPGGTCLVLSFHSLEDRIVKRHFHGIELQAPKNMSLSHQQLHNSVKVFDNDSLQKMVNRKWIPLTKKVIIASETEVKINPRSRSAKLRAANKC